MTELPRLVCASANPHKVAEIAAILAGVVELLPRPADVAEVVEEIRSGKFANIAERSGRAQDKDDGGGLETLRRDGYM